VVVFLDTSSLVKLYYYEADSEVLVQKISEKADSIFIFELSKVEFTSALWKKVRMGGLDKKTCEEVLQLFANDAAKYQWVLLSSDIAAQAVSLLNKYGMGSLRTLDALQLAAAVSLNNTADVFVTSDDFLKGLFTQEGLPTAW